MAMPQQVQLLQPQFQVMPNQPMLVNAQGQIIGNGQQQFQIINHGTALPQSGQSGQSVQNLPSGATLVQAAPSQQLPNGSTVLTIQQADKVFKLLYKSLYFKNITLVNNRVVRFKF